jgi:hypothetical protein
MVRVEQPDGQVCIENAKKAFARSIGIEALIRGGWIDHCLVEFGLSKAHSHG